MMLLKGFQTVQSESKRKKTGLICNVMRHFSQKQQQRPYNNDAKTQSQRRFYSISFRCYRNCFKNIVIMSLKPEGSIYFLLFLAFKEGWKKVSDLIHLFMKISEFILNEVS
jgi:hypothetical protein